MPGIADLGKLLSKGGVAEQLLVWGVLNQVLGAVLGPEMEMLTRSVNELLQATPLSPADLADMVVRHVVEMQDATAYAKQSGVAPSDFLRLVQAAGEGPAPGDLAEALRRGLIEETGTGPDATSYEQGFAESHLRDKWREVVKALAVRLPSPGDALDALLTGQLPEARSRDLFARFGGDPEHFDWLFDTRGSAPTPVELSVMANRQIVPWDGEGPGTVSFHQGFLEGPWRDKWEGPYRKLAEYHPPARTITAMVRSGALSDEQALTLFRQEGLSQEMAAAMLQDAHHQKLQGSKDLARSDVEQLYRDQVISAQDAAGMLSALDYTADEIALLLQLQDVKRAVQYVNTAISRVHTLYVNRHVGRTDAVNALNALGVPDPQQQALLATWDVERTSNAKVLTAAEIASAFFYNILDQETALAQLVAIGYTPFRAWILLSVRKHGALPNPPAPDPVE